MHFKLIIATFTFIMAMNPLLTSAMEPEPIQNIQSSGPLINAPTVGHQSQDSYAKRGFVDDLLNEVDYQQQSLSTHLIDFTETIDTFFISDDVESRINYSYIQLGYRYTRYKDGTEQLDPVFTAHIHLPRTQNRLTLEVSNNSLFSSSNDASSVNSAGSSSPVDQNNIDQALHIGLGYVREFSELFNAKLTGGARVFGHKMKLFINLQLYSEFFFKKWSLRLSEDLYRDNIVFSTAITQVLFERKISDDQLFRSISKNIYYEDLGYSQNHQTLYVFDQLSKRDAMIYQVGAMWENKHGLSDYALDNYYAMVRYSRMIYKDWLFMEISPQVQYLETENFHPKPLIALQFSAFFGNNK
ncbi:MAG: hypothetical protein R8M46_05500 [Ghiorsea sp.]